MNKRGHHGALWIILIIALLLLGSGFYLKTYFAEQEEYAHIERFKYIEGMCGDGTLDAKCSSRKPYYCQDAELVELASICGCPENMTLNVNKDGCYSEYQTGPKKINLEYVLRGEKGEINYTVYKGVTNYLFELPQYIVSMDDDVEPTIADFEYFNIEEPVQKQFLLPLVTEIQNLAPSSKEDQMRIALSLVQRIPYAESNKTIEIDDNNFIEYSRRPYEVLYEMQGICDDKSELLVFLLKEIGYDVIIFQYFDEDHQAVGIKCPEKHSLYGSGYCFAETTTPAILGDDTGEYFGLGKLVSKPSILVLYEEYEEGQGLSLAKLYEYDDAENWIKVNDEIMSAGGKVSKWKYEKWQELIDKYGLDIASHVISQIQKYHASAHSF